MAKHQLSKSSFIKGLQCEKQLYLYKHHYDWMDPVSNMQQAVFDRGTDVGELAQQLFPGGINSKPETHLEYAKAAKKTEKLIEEGIKIIYEAVFIYNGVLVISDIIRKHRGKWQIYEVKSSTSVKDVHFYDAAIQYYVLNGLGLNISDVSIVHLNNEYVREGDLDIRQLFTIHSLYDDVIEIQSEIEENVTDFKKMLKRKSIPDIDIGEHCFNPYSCSFLGHCWKQVPEYSVFNLNRLHKNKKFELYYEGIVNIEDIPEDHHLSFSQRMQVDSHINNNTIVEKREIKQFLDGFTYPLYFMDFETFQPAVPMFDLSKPYQQIPFQFSVHVQKTKKGEPLHYEFLAEADGTDTRIPFIEALLNLLGDKGSIVVYNQSFERSRLNEIAAVFPKYKKRIEAVNERLVDLMIPFQKKWYYSPGMKGSYSIKSVLPSLVPELSYSNMEIADGAAASHMFYNLYFENNPKIIDATRRNLLQYCGLDTFGMIMIYEKLLKIK